MTEEERNEMTFRKFHGENGSDIEEELEEMTVEELLQFAAYTFKVMLNKYKSAETLVEEIMALFEAAEQKEVIRECNLVRKEIPEFAKNW